MTSFTSFVDKLPYRQLGPSASYTTDDKPEDLPPLEASFGSWPDTLKVSKAIDVTVKNKMIRNWSEDCLDLVRVRDSIFEKFTLFPYGKNGITAKGASVGIQLGFKLLANGRECDVELGQFDNYWYPGREPTREIYITVDPAGKAALVRLWDAKDVVVTGPHRLVREPKWKWYPYFLFRYAQIRVENVWRKLTKQPLIVTK
jgi:hypothetical protein